MVLMQASPLQLASNVTNNSELNLRDISSFWFLFLIVCRWSFAEGKEIFNFQSIEQNGSALHTSCKHVFL
jgi:hypothetical protein